MIRLGSRPHARRFATIAAAVILGAPIAPAGASGQSATLEELIVEAARAVVLIDVQTPSGNRQGSGFLVDPSGRILTNEHVIRGARTARVKLGSGDVYDMVTILATDERRDIAVLQVPGFDLPALQMGNSDSVRIGNQVVLIGSPLGLENTVTTGIVSGRRQEPEGFQLLQISAPASRGSSGGPLLSQDGQVVGMASSQMQSGQNLNFAIPINYARGLLTHLEGEPMAVLRPPQRPEPNDPVPMTAESETVNQGLGFDLETFNGWVLETEARTGTDTRKRTRISYRIIETVGGGEPRIERYMESEVARRTGPFASEQTVRRERVRTLVRADGLQPVSTRGEIVEWTGDGWEQTGYDLTFDAYRVSGLVTGVAGRAEELDRQLPRGIILREVADLAFATLTADSLVGRSVELVTFDPLSGDVMNDRYDVLGTAALTVAGEEYQAIRVNVARGLSNATAWLTAERPRVLLRLEGGDEFQTEEVVRLEINAP